MAPALPPCTVRAVDTAKLLDIEEEAAAYGFSQRLPVAWLQEYLADEATHYLLPILVHRLRHRPDVSPQWRCQLLLTMRTGEQIWSLLDVLPDTFAGLPETLDAASQKDIASRVEQAETQCQWSERMVAEAGPGAMPRN